MKTNLFKSVLMIMFAVIIMSVMCFPAFAAEETSAPETEVNSGDIGNVDVNIKDGHITVDGVGDDAPWETVIMKFKGVIAGITGVCTMIMIVLFILSFMKLGSSAGNPTQRTQALVGILWTGVATALLGSVTIWIGFFYNAL